MEILKGLVCFCCYLILLFILLPWCIVCGAFRGIGEEIDSAFERSMDMAVTLRKMMVAKPAATADGTTSKKPQPQKEQ